MRVVGGELGGRRLASPPGRSRAVRPTAERVREAIFSVLGDRVEDALVLDLFCGTGALGIEALSRGASRAVLVDRAPSLARRNVRDLGLETRAQVVGSDALSFLRRSRARFDLVLCDPPYRLADRLDRDLDSLVRPRLAKDACVILESSARNPIRLSLPILRERPYGEAHLAVYGEGDG